MDQPEINARALTSALRAVAEDEASRGASSAVEGRLIIAVRSVARTNRRRRIAVHAIAATLLVAVGIPAWRMTARRTLTPAIPVDGRGRVLPNVPGGEVATAFFPLVYSNVPVTDGRIVRLVVPRAALASFGLTTEDSFAAGPSSSSTVLADVVVGEDGLARAVRFVRPVMAGANVSGVGVAKQEKKR